MAKKKIILTAFAALVALGSFSVLASGLLTVSAPTFVDERTKVRTRQAAVLSEVRSIPAKPVPMPPGQRPFPASEPVESVSAPIVVKIEEPLTIVQSEPVVDTEIAPAAPGSEAPGSFYVSEWLELPRSVTDHIGFSAALAVSVVEQADKAAEQFRTSYQSVPVLETKPKLNDPEIADTVRSAPAPRVELETAAASQDVTAAVNESSRLVETESPGVMLPELEPDPGLHRALLSIISPVYAVVFERRRPDAELSALPSVRVADAIANSPALAKYEPASANEMPPEVSRPAAASPQETLTSLSHNAFQMNKETRFVKLHQPLTAPDTSPSAPEKQAKVTPPSAVSRPALSGSEVAKTVISFLPSFVFRWTTAPVINSGQVGSIDIREPEPISGNLSVSQASASQPEDRFALNEHFPMIKTEVSSVPPVASGMAISETSISQPEDRFALNEHFPLIKTEVAVVPPVAPNMAVSETSNSQPEGRFALNEHFPLIKAEVSAAPQVAPGMAVSETSNSQPEGRFALNEHFPLIKSEVSAAPPVATGLVISETSVSPSEDRVALDQRSLFTKLEIAQAPSAKPLTVLINGQTAFTAALLQPFGVGTVANAPVFSETLTASNRGPSIPTETDDPRLSSGAPKNPTGPLPVLISGRTGFSMDLLKPLNSAAAAKPFYVSTPLLTPKDPRAVARTAKDEGSFCDPNFVGEPIRFSQTVELKLDDLLNQLHARFGVNFIAGPEIGKMPLNVKAGSIPWNVLLRSQLYISGVRATCINNNTVELVLNSQVSDLEKGRTDAERLESRYIKLKYLQPSSSGNKNIAGQSSGGGNTGQGGVGQSQCQSGTTGGQGGAGQSGSGQLSIPQRCKFERLINEIRQILGLNDQGLAAGTDSLRFAAPSDDQTSASVRRPEILKRPYVGQVPGRNMLMVNASASQLKEIEELIRHADVPPFQVVIKGLIYTANEDKLKDIGVQTTITEAGSGRTTGGVFGHTLGSLGTLFDFSTMIGTFDFNVQASALQRDGVISIKSRPFATVLDGDTTDLTVGRQVPVLIQAINPIGGAPGTLQILQAANLLSVTPHVIDDEKGNPTAVNLELQLESNDVDASILSQGVPTVSVRSIQSNFILNQEQTAILGGFTVDSDSKTVSKTPGLGDIPILGELFKRRVRSTQVNRLYFAISVTVIPYGGTIEPVKVPGANTDPPSLTPTMLDRSNKAEPKTVATPKKDPDN